ncbi:MAG TPA: DUF1080 domain-containing protein [Verrucomicrobiales bacterium]|nr:DUF1080 domain-containing protein [Verrucomicrobiales bacterium]
MKKLITILFVTALSFQAIAEEKGFEKIFDGKTLKGWDGNPKFWSVKDGAITGQTTKDNPTKGNTFIIWKAGTTKNFILELEYKITAGNSGIQYRSFKKGGENDGWRIGGYQADFEAGDRYSGICYGEAFRGILSDRGFHTTLTLNDKGKLQKKAEKFGDPKEIGKAVKKGEWNKYRIVAEKFHFVHYINDVKTMVLVDNDEKARRADGLLALQLHQGPPMTVQFRNIRIKHLK